MKGKRPKEKALGLPAPRDGDSDAAVDQVLDALGLRETASLVMVSGDELAIAAAAVLGGICAPNPRIETALGTSGLQPLDVMFESESDGIRDAFDFLTFQLAELQRLLVRSLERYDPGTIRLITHGLREKQWATKALGTFAGNTINSHLSALHPVSGTDGFTLQDDTAPDPLGVRAEAVIHPRFLLVDFPAREWIGQADECHQRQALLVLRTDLAGDPDRNLPAMIKTALKLTEGIRSGTGGSRGTDNPITIRALLALNQEDRIGAAGAGAFRRLLLVPAGSAPEVPVGRESILFPAAYHEIAGRMIEERRREELPVIRFDAPGNRARFSAELRDFEKECRLPAEGTGLAAMGLPGALFRLFALLVKTGRFGDIAEEQLIAAAFGLSRRALASHAAAQRELVVASHLVDGMERAFRIVEKLEASEEEGKARLPARMIIRKFDKQRTAGFRPVFDALVGVGVLDLEGNLYGLGEVCITDAEDQLRAKLAAFYGVA
jgi:hypothetical protein